MSTASEYRRFLKECLRWAERARSDEERDAFLEAARYFRGTPATRMFQLLSMLNAESRGRRQLRRRRRHTNAKLWKLIEVSPQ
jgi:hypothetical protein